MARGRLEQREEAEELTSADQVIPALPGHCSLHFHHFTCTCPAASCTCPLRLHRRFALRLVRGTLQLSGLSI
eukprot:7639413-Pyramimonas_sp.AAC.1